MFIDKSKIIQIYKGKPDVCRCGCAGNYYDANSRSWKRAMRFVDDLLGEEKIEWDADARCYDGVVHTDSKPKVVTAYMSDDYDHDAYQMEQVARFEIIIGEQFHVSETSSEINMACLC